jgi:hypothetical protein
LTWGLLVARKKNLPPCDARFPGRSHPGVQVLPALQLKHVLEDVVQYTALGQRLKDTPFVETGLVFVVSVAAFHGVFGGAHDEQDVGRDAAVASITDGFLIGADPSHIVHEQRARE